jgi:hypothetical protein
MRILGLHIVMMWRPHSKETSVAFNSGDNVCGRSVALFKGDIRRDEGHLGTVETQDDKVLIYNGAGFRFKAVEMWLKFRQRHQESFLKHRIL